MRALGRLRLAAATLPLRPTPSPNRLHARPLLQPLAMYRTAAGAGSDADRAAAAAAAALRRTTGRTPPATPSRPQHARRVPGGRPCPPSQGLWEKYLAALEDRPVLTKALTCFVGGVLGDALAQAAGGAPFSLARNLRLASFGLIWGGPAGHLLHRTLDARVRLATPVATVAAKLAIDQLLFAPLSTALLFLFLKCAEGAPEAAFSFLQAHFASTLAKNYAIWPAANALAFSVIPGDLRILFANVVGVLYCAWISASSLGGGLLPPPPSVVDAVAGVVGGGSAGSS